MDQDDGLEGGSAFVGQLMERFLFAPALLQQGLTHHTGRAFEARAEVEGDVRARLSAAAARQVHLKPAERVHTGAGSPGGQRGPAKAAIEALYQNLVLKSDLFLFDKNDDLGS